MPGLATKGSVFNGTAPDDTFLYNRCGNNYQETVAYGTTPPPAAPALTFRRGGRRAVVSFDRRARRSVSA